LSEDLTQNIWGFQKSNFDGRGVGVVEIMNQLGLCSLGKELSQNPPK